MFLALLEIWERLCCICFLEFHQTTLHRYIFTKKFPLKNVVYIILELLTVMFYILLLHIKQSTEYLRNQILKNLLYNAEQTREI